MRTLPSRTGLRPVQLLIPTRDLHCLGGARFSLPIRAKLGLLLIALTATLAFAQQPQQRDLKVERLDTVPAAKPLQIPVSYAVIVGISRYLNQIGRAHV